MLTMRDDACMRVIFMGDQTMDGQTRLNAEVANSHLNNCLRWSRCSSVRGGGVLAEMAEVCDVRWVVNGIVPREPFVLKRS